MLRWTAVAANTKNLAMMIFLLSLGGIPPMGGFIGKFFVFAAAIKAELYGLATMGVLMTAVSVYFYFRIVVMMFMKEPTTDTPYALSAHWSLAIGIALVATVAIGVYPGPFLQFAEWSVLQVPDTLATISSLR